MAASGDNITLTGDFEIQYDIEVDGGQYRGMWFRATGGSVEIQISPLHFAGEEEGSEVIPEDGYVERFCFGGVRLSDGSYPSSIIAVYAKTDDGGSLSFGPVMN